MNTMLDPRALIPILYDPTALSILQQQNPSFFSSIQKNVGNSTTSPSTGSFRIHDLLESSTKGENNPILGNSATASAMFAQMMNANFTNFKSGILTGINSDKANSSGENDSLLDDLEGNQSSFSPRSSSAESPPPNERSTDRASNCSTSSVGGPIHGKKARKARTIFTDKQLQELENTFERQKYLSVQDRVDLAHRMGLSDTQVKTWYQNRRTKWKRQAAVGVDLLQEASNMAAVQNLLRTSPYWNQFTRSFFGQEHFLRGMAPMGTSMNPGFPGMMMPPGMIPPGMPPFNTFSMNHANFSGISEKSSESVKLSKTDESSKKESAPSSESSKNDQS